MSRATQFNHLVEMARTARLPIVLRGRFLTLFRAALGQGQTGIDAYRAWRASEPLEAADEIVYRTMPLLLATVDKAGIVDADTRKMRGVVKHVWLSNATRVRDLVEADRALEAAGIAALLIKGGALFARDESYMAKRMTGDYDLLVRRSEASRAIEVLRRASFRSHGMKVELFSESDYDRDIHAVAMSRAGFGRAIDLHWRAIFWLDDESFTEELFRTAERAKLLSYEVLIPGLAEELAIAAMRPEPADQKEMVFRALEVVHVLENYGDKVDWDRFRAIVTRYNGSLFAAQLLDVVAREMPALVPDGLVEQLWRYGPPGKSVEIGLRAVPPAHRSQWQHFAVAFFASLRAQFKAPFRLLDWLRLPGAAMAAFDASVVHFPHLHDAILKRVWQQASAATHPLRGREVWFGQGFSIPEDEGRWTDHQFAVIDVPVEARSQAFAAIELGVIPFLPPGTDSFRFAAYTGTGEVFRIVAERDDPMPFKLMLKAKIVGTDRRKIVVALRMLDSGRPMDIGHSIDHRLLGLFVTSVAVDGVAVFTPAAAAP
ncbi:nucleotidyltransferase family protein [Bradyrhizobium sp. BR 10289]|uniref:nucleotidyltransferase family protein n=1 Tax=Bradyrhizobium sp. BR 10289 TaxID=2749993 RepID=UPI001C646E95|nr:nucleotidyltransferase family protein [Bradyrhizobium sp. BR 10289]MBW7974271.1 nucleotidyltransferase family protein [Bradyrhizobium sp. BR 10289]